MQLIMRLALSLFFLHIFLVFCSCSQEPTNPNPDMAAIAPTPSRISAANASLFVPSGLTWRTQHYEAENCNIQATDDMDLDGWCATRSVDIIILSLNNKPAAQKINQALVKRITGNGTQLNDVNQYVQQVKLKNISDEEGDVAQEEVMCKVVDTSSNFCAISINTYYYALGAAHGTNSVDVLNFDLQDGSLITLDRLIDFSKKNSLTALAKKKFLQQNEGDDWWFTSGEEPFTLPEVFVLERKGIRFIYQQYEIGPYAAGIPEVFLSKQDLMSYLKVNPFLVP